MNFITNRSGAGKRYEPWSSLISDVIDMAFKASRIASPVVTSDSPEGFLPGNYVLFGLKGAIKRFRFVLSIQTDRPE